MKIFDEDFVEESYRLLMTPWEERMGGVRKRIQGEPRRQEDTILLAYSMENRSD